MLLSASALIMAGGKSSRMGEDKTRMTLGGRSLTQRAVDLWSTVFEEVLLSVDRQGKFQIPGAREVPDLQRGRGPLAGIYAGLLAAGSDRIFVCAADIPFASAAAAKALYPFAMGADVAVPVLDGRYEPLFAFYAKSALPAVEEVLASGENRMTALFGEKRGLRVNAVDGAVLEQAAGQPLERIFFNVNTPQNFNEVRQELESSPADKGGIRP